MANAMLAAMTWQAMWRDCAVDEREGRRGFPDWLE